MSLTAWIRDRFGSTDTEVDDDPPPKCDGGTAEAVDDTTDEGPSIVADGQLDYDEITANGVDVPQDDFLGQLVRALDGKRRAVGYIDETRVTVVIHDGGETTDGGKAEWVLDLSAGKRVGTESETLSSTYSGPKDNVIDTYEHYVDRYGLDERL